MNNDIQSYVNAYSQYIDDFDQYDNGKVRIEYNNPSKVMWLKRMAFEVANLTEITATMGTNRIVMYFE